MALINKNSCPNCGAECSPYKTVCPSCGASLKKPSRRTPPSSDAVRKGTGAARREEENARWRLVLGLCLIAAIIIAVIVLITTTLSGDYDAPATPTPSQEIIATPSPTLEPTPTPTPTVDWVSITYAGETRTEFAVAAGGAVQMGSSHFPIEVIGDVEWSSADENICKVDAAGVVTGIAPGTTSIIARLYGAAAECRVYVT